ncbi:arylsulfatase [Microbacterium yannicii]|uniref:arylsulfatase n=1 Tax=Microbacterium yannicii TaxID=671622 RepID=UPI0002E6ADC5|nr:arylsulfatase [Microbacterium yannicii]
MTDSMAALGRENLPIPDRAVPGLTTFDAKDPDTFFAPIVPLRPPAGAPNVLVVLLDDVGFGASSSFGGPIATPTFDRLASAGLKYTRFHTTALCAPTRQALLTGRNHHSVGMGSLTELATSAPGYSSLRPNSCAPLADVLRLNGYSTAQFGKCHEVPVWQSSPMGPFDAWPTGAGFEHFYGFIGAETNQYAPALYRDTVPVEPDLTADEGYHLTEDLADHAIGWIQQQRALMPDKPFFIYLAPGATHAPHHCPTEWSDRYRGRFDDGWDVLREEIVVRQRELGVIPPDAELTTRPEEIPSWDDMPDGLHAILARQMEVYAGYLSHVDHHIGRVIDALDALDALDDTLVMVIIGDNGASAEGTINGTFNELLSLNGLADMETIDFLAERIDKFGTPAAYNHYAVGWAHAMDTPYQWTKQVASHWGGTRNGTIVSWPGGIASKGEMRHQFHHVIDVAATVLDVAGLPEPTAVHGVQQRPLEGVSMTYSFDDVDAPDRHETQYFEIMGNRGIYHKGWTAVTRHSTPWAFHQELPSFDDDAWELYGPEDWTQSRNLATRHPDQLRRLQQLFVIEAAKYNVFPLDDRRIERFNPDLAGRPVLIRGNSQLLFSGMGRLTENVVVNVKNKSFAVTAEVDLAASPGTGVVIAQGGAFGGWSLYLHEGRPAFCYNLCGIELTKIYADRTVEAGEHQLRMEFAYDGGGLAKGGTVSLYVDGQSAGGGRIERTQPMVFSADETTDLGADSATPVSDDYGPRDSQFTGRVAWVQIDLGEDAGDADHFITPEERLRVVMTRQ